MLDIRQRHLGGIARVKSAWSAPALVVALLFAANPAAAQECETDADCGFGFQCYSDTLVSGSVTGGTSGTAGASTPVCGNNLCEFGETWEACPSDCERYTYCAGAECEANSDCAEGYQCQAGGGNSSSGSTGGDTGPVCGDGWCDSSELDSCESDCVPVCQQVQVLDTCETNADCDEGYYCDFSQGANSDSSSDGGSTLLGLCALIETTTINSTTAVTTNGGTTGGTTAGGGQGGEPSDDTVSSSSDDSNSASLSTVSAVTTGGSSDGDGNSSDGSASNGGPGAGGSGSGGSGHSGGNGNGNGNGNGHGNGNGGGWHPWPKPGYGCSVGGDAASGGAGTMLFALSAALGWVATRRRRVV